MLKSVRIFSKQLCIAYFRDMELVCSTLDVTAVARQPVHSVRQKHEGDDTNLVKSIIRFEPPPKKVDHPSLKVDVEFLFLSFALPRTASLGLPFSRTALPPDQNLAVFPSPAATFVLSFLSGVFLWGSQGSFCETL